MVLEPWGGEDPFVVWSGFVPALVVVVVDTG
jgi:hypothetical protein